MSRNIRAIFIDTGNTMRVVAKNAEHQAQIRQQLVSLVGTEEPAQVLYERLVQRYNGYKQWSKDQLVEASEEEIWTRWMLPDFPPERITPLAGELTLLWLDRNGKRTARPEARPTVIELARRGYILGVLANTISRTDIPDWLKADAMDECFKVVILSSLFGKRKPDPAVYLEAAHRAGVEPAQCAYVGDNPSRDVAGARQAGFAKIVIMLEQATLNKEPPKGRNLPDALVGEFTNLLNIFPPLNFD